MTTFVVTLDIECSDLEQLRLDAERHAVASGVELGDWRTTRTGPGSDLQMLLDPGDVAQWYLGILNSNVEQIDD